MADRPILQGYPLPTHPEMSCGRATEGFLTPTQCTLPQVCSIPPRRVLPIIFLPGIMGSNLRLSAERQRRLDHKNNIAWRPENKVASLKLAIAKPRVRQLQLDPATTEVDSYDPVGNLTGDPDETSDQRHSNVNGKLEYPFSVGIDTPLLQDDPVTTVPRKMKEQRARERGWGEVFYDSYRQLLEMCELRLNSAVRMGKIDPWWQQILNVNPMQWQAHSQPPVQALESKALCDAVQGCWFPVHAMGYNWLQSNRESGTRVAARINELMERYRGQGYQCQKVIVVTHSMGGLVARALIHPKMGNMHDKVLGIVHGVMPAIGAGATYKRMRCGFEDSPFSIAPKVLGNYGAEVTAVLGNAPGGLELLPSQAYGNDWLQVQWSGKTVMSLPKNGDPYEEIYKLRDKWYGLLREDWINPAGLFNGGFDRTCVLLDKAKAFHNQIVATYHDCSYAHYGADRGRAAWHRVVWSFEGRADIRDVENLTLSTDNGQGRIRVNDPCSTKYRGPEVPEFSARMLEATDPGDQTVPLHSAEHQLRSGKFKGLFRQSGYEHQCSYQNEAALHSTLYSLVRIAQTMTWTT